MSLLRGHQRLSEALQRAQAGGLDRLDAQSLLLHALGRPVHDRAWLLAHDDMPLSPEQLRAYGGCCQRRAQGEPLAYIVGEKEFFGLRLQIDSRVLVPRADTETLVQWALEAMQDTPRPHVLDMGTGSGAIALAIQAQRPDARVFACDASEAALQVATANARALRLAVRFVHSCWFSRIQGRFDLIVSNPPYIAQGDVHLHALRHEPPQALTAGKDGLGDIRAIAAQAPTFLDVQGWLLLEHGWDQADAVTDILRAQGYHHIAYRRDLAGIIRCTGAQKAPP